MQMLSAGGGIEASFVQVQLTLELAENRVVDAAFVAEANSGVAFDAQKLAREFDELGVIVGVDAVGGIGLAGDGGEAALVANEGILIGGGKVMGVARGLAALDVFERGSDHRSTGFFFFQIGPVHTRKAENAD